MDMNAMAWYRVGVIGVQPLSRGAGPASRLKRGAAWQTSPACLADKAKKPSMAVRGKH